MKGWLRRFWYTRGSGVVLIVFLGLIWELSVQQRWIEAFSWPALSVILKTWVGSVVTGEVVFIFLPTFLRLMVGYLLAAAVGIGLGLLMGYFRPVFCLFEPIVELLRPIPSPAYIPVIILFLGIDWEMKIFMISLASFFPILLNTFSGVRAVDEDLIQTGQTFGLSNRRIVAQIVLPSSAPYIFTGLRISLAVSIIVAVLSEMIASNDGIGFYVLHSQRTFRIAEMYSGIISLGIFGYLLNQIFVWVERRALRWHLETNQA